AFEDDIEPRAQVPCYDDTASTSDRAAARRARSVTIVRLDSGEIIRTFRRSASDAPASIAGRVTLAPLDSPIMGQPVAYPGWTGAIADRAYVGDRDGTLWRMDLASHRPSDWSVKLFFDAYHGSTNVHAGQPIATTPIVSTNEDGQVVVLFSTGSQEDLVGTAQTVNYVYSVREAPTTGATAPMVPKVNWFRQFTAGTRAAGPMTLFSSVVYFSTYSPPTSSYGCDAGSSSIWGMHFVSPEDSLNLGKGGKAALPEAGNSSSSKRVQELTSDGTLIAAGSTIFGVGVAQLQGCYTTTEVSDPYLGMKYDRIDSGSLGKYQLVVQTGKAGTSSAQGSTNYATIDLPQPDTSPRISAWALVME
ncbi:MAG: PilC/PilY family type IV pilus protein, partial [Myxococcales bacterium]